MTIQEAIKSGRPFKRKDYEWMLFHGDRVWLTLANTHWIQTKTPIGSFVIEDILANDWEIKEGGK